MSDREDVFAKSNRKEIIMLNLNNMVMLRGRLAKDPVIFENADHTTGEVKSYTAVIRLAVKRDYRSSEEADFIDLKQFFGTESGMLNFYKTLLAKGDKVAVAASVRNNNYKDAQGTMHYTNDLVIEKIDLDEPRSAREARRAEGEAPVEAAEPVVEDNSIEL